ncbi:hypothetical protein D9619_000954 [Psilocybe cf. subviscida]|uniref:Uncharacterized protein n=1 Tax=Psilocybe cf. subviscida TaxID=2480587 RepID=A0A8H5BEN6_9AGAR|nr:hypothetical protein D9619_000954 [Psilocybe cf. subviscida]
MFIVISQWDPASDGCVVVQTNPSMLNMTFFFTTSFDFIILLFTAVALQSRHSARTGLWNLLFQDGLVYFIVSFSTNCIPAVLNVLDLNTPMNVIGMIPATTVTSIAACRAVMRLLDFNAGGVLLYPSPAGIANSNAPGLAHCTASRLRASSGNPKRAEVRVTTEQMTMTELATSRTCPTYSINNRRQESLSADVRSSKDVDILSIHDDKESTEGSSV